MARRLPNYVRTFRKRAGLSQEEMAILLGCSSGSKVSRYERFARQPTLSSAFTYEALFGVPVREIFAGVYDDATKELRRRARVLRKRLENNPRTGVRKARFLDTLFSTDEQQTHHN